MTPKTKGFVKYSVIVIIIAVILGGCKKDKTEEEKPTPPPKETTSLGKPNIESTPPPVDNAEALRKMQAAEANKPSEIARIAAATAGVDSALAKYYGKAAPNLTMKDLDGNSLNLSGVKGKKTVIVKWSTRYEPSKQMVKTLAELQKQVGDENLAVIAFSSDDPAILKPVVKSMDLPFPVAGRQGRRMVAPYRINAEMPVCFFIDKEGKIQLITVKVIPPDVLNSLVEVL
ncbi:MAG: redoxin domain-containing protein [Planctomycetes bacterium]|nr:redoxin domain-containing protein [Planctomycetota bacterium]